jgi:hypothetical protein
MNGKVFSLLFFGLNDNNYPYTRISHEILKCCADNGAEVSAFFIKNKELETSFLDERVKITECPNYFKSKALTYLTYSILSFFYIFREFYRNSNTCFIVPTTPPFTLTFVVAFVKLLTFGKLKWVYHIQDIHPEISFVSKNKSHVFSFLRRLDTFFIQSSNKAITLSEEMKSALVIRKNSLKDSIFVANNYVEEFSVSDYRFNFLENDKRDGKIIYIFSGNVGKYQRVVEIVELFLELDEFDGILYILGDGDELPSVKKLLSDHNNKNRIRLLGRKPFDEANQLAAQCDYGIVSLNAEITKYAYPSKFATYLSMGLKVLSFIEQDSQIAKEIERHNLGDVVSNNEKFGYVISHSESLTHKERERIKAASKELFGKLELVSKNCEILESIK